MKRHVTIADYQCTISVACGTTALLSSTYMYLLENYVLVAVVGLTMNYGEESNLEQARHRMNE
jgi:hypothetical protein